MPGQTERAPGDTADEAGLVARARENDAAAWGEIYSLHNRQVYRYVRARVFDEATAEDLTSTVFLSALQGIRKYRERGRPLLAWLYAIARNTVADHQRKAVSRGRLRDRLPGPGSRSVELPLEEIATSDEDPGHSVERLDLRRAVSRLPEAQREVIILRHFVGLATPEIAAAMKKKPSAVYSLEARALENLRAALGARETILPASDEKQPVETINE